MKFTFTEVLRITSICSIAIPILAYILKRNISSRQNHIIGILIVFWCLLDISGSILYSRKISNVLLFNIGHLVQFVLLSWFYYVILNNRRRIFLVASAVWIIALGIVVFNIQDFSMYQGIVWAISGLILIIYGVMYFNNIFITLPVDEPYLYSTLWINVALVFYFSFNMWLYVMSEYVLNGLGAETARIAWSSHNINNIIKNILLAFGLYNSRKKYF
jgi:hypothetical protein